MQIIEKTFFIISFGIVCVMYGTIAGEWKWFPHSLLNQAKDQAQAVYRSYSSESVPLGEPVYERTGVRAPRPEEMQPGMTLITSSWKTSDGWSVGLRLIDSTGGIVHEWYVDRREVFQGDILRMRKPKHSDITGSYLLPNGDVLVNLTYIGLVRLDACGDVLWTLEEGNHHSIDRANDGTFWVPGTSDGLRSRSEQYPEGFPGFNGKEVVLDRILNVSRSGEILRDINVLDVLYKNGLERFIPKVLGGVRPTPKTVRTDLTHLNDLEPLSPSMASEYPLFEEGDLLVSLRSLSLVFVFDPNSLTVKWHASEPFIYQHDPDFLGNGWIGTFDNNYDLTDRGTMLGGNRIIALQPHTDSMEIRFPTRHSPQFYTNVEGKWQRLENGNMLLTESMTGRVVEVDPQGRIVWEWIHEYTDDLKVPNVSKGVRRSLTRADVASWPCSSVDSVRTASQNQ